MRKKLTYFKYFIAIPLCFLANAFAAEPVAFLTSPEQSEMTVNVGDSVKFQINASDADGDLLGTDWYGNGDTPYSQIWWNVEGEPNRSNSVFHREHTFNNEGDFTITAQVYDANYAYAPNLVFNVTVVGGVTNTTPLVISTSPEQHSVVINVGESLNFAITASDVEGNLAGSEWYGKGDNPFLQNLNSASGDGNTATFSREHTFDYAGNYSITGLVYDDQYLYTDAVVWDVRVDAVSVDHSATEPSTLGQRALYIDDFDVVLSSTTNTDKLLAHIQAHNITKLTVYNLHTQLPSKSAEISTFIFNAKRLGVTSVGAAGGSAVDFDRVMAYQHDDNFPHKFDSLYLEYEYWNHDPDVSNFVALLDHMSTVGDDMEIEAYLGWLNEEDYAPIANRLDNLFLHCYVQDPSSAFSYCKERMKKFGELNKNLNIWPIFSAEWRPTSTCDNPPWSEEALCFMGKWFELNGIANAENVFMEKYNAESGAWKSGLSIPGFHYFAYTFLDAEVGSPDTPDYTELPVSVRGDWDGDGDVDMIGVLAFMKALQKREVIDTRFDLNDDGVINILDVRSMMDLCTRERCAS